MKNVGLVLFGKMYFLYTFSCQFIGNAYFVSILIGYFIRYHISHFVGIQLLIVTHLLLKNDQTFASPHIN